MSVATLTIYLEDGFEHDKVVVAAGGSERTEPDATTRHQVGLASVVELDPPPGRATTVRVALPDRGLAAETEVDPATTPYVRVAVADGRLTVRAQPAPPMFA